MIMTNKIVAVALITAVIGAGLGAAVMHTRDSATVAEANTTVPGSATAWDNARDAKYTNAAEQTVPSEFNTAEGQTAYKVGFADGFKAAQERGTLPLAQSGLGTRNVPVSR